MVKNFLFAVLVLNLFIPFVQADNQECIVNRDRNIPLYGKECTKQGEFYLVHTCDTGTICKANAKNVHFQSNTCKQSPSAPRFAQAYKEANSDAILNYLKEHPSVLKIHGSSEAGLAAKITAASQNQRVAIAELSAGQAMLSNNKEVVKALTQKKIEYLYTVEDRNGREFLSAYEVRRGGLKKIPPKEAVPQCN